MMLNPSRTESDKAFDRIVNNLTEEENFSSSIGSYGKSSTSVTTKRSLKTAYSPTKTTTQKTTPPLVTEKPTSTTKKRNLTIPKEVLFSKQIKEMISDINPNIWFVGVLTIGIVLSTSETDTEFSHVTNTIILTKQGVDREIEFNLSTGHLRVIPKLKYSDQKKESSRDKESDVLKILERKNKGH